MKVNCVHFHLVKKNCEKCHLSFRRIVSPAVMPAFHTITHPTWKSVKVSESLKDSRKFFVLQGHHSLRKFSPFHLVIMIYFHHKILLLFWDEFMPWSAFSQSHNLFLSLKPNTLPPTSTFLTWIHSPLSLSLFASAFTFSWSLLCALSTFSSLLCAVFTFSSLPCSGQDSAPQSFKSCNLSLELLSEICNFHSHSLSLTL